MMEASVVSVGSPVLQVYNCKEFSLFPCKTLKILEKPPKICALRYRGGKTAYVSGSIQISSMEWGGFENQSMANLPKWHQD